MVEMKAIPRGEDRLEIYANNKLIGVLYVTHEGEFHGRVKLGKVI